MTQDMVDELRGRSHPHMDMLRWYQVTLKVTFIAATSTTSVKLDTETKERIQRLASARHRSTHWLMRAAIRQYVEREEEREALRQTALDARESYQATGSTPHGR